VNADYTGRTALTTPSTPAWLKIYRYFTEEPPPLGTVVSHDMLSQIAGLDFENARHRSLYYHSVAKACIELENENYRTLLTERGEGYRYVGGNAHLEKAINGAIAVRRKLIRVAGTVATVDVSGLSNPEVERVRHAQRTILAQMDTVNGAYFPPPSFTRTPHLPEE
jgi:hypothetical protein